MLQIGQLPQTPSTGQFPVKHSEEQRVIDQIAVSTIICIVLKIMQYLGHKNDQTNPKESIRKLKDMSREYFQSQASDILPTLAFTQKDLQVGGNRLLKMEQTSSSQQWQIEGLQNTLPLERNLPMFAYDQIEALRQEIQQTNKQLLQERSKRAMYEESFESQQRQIEDLQKALFRTERNEQSAYQQIDQLQKNYEEQLGQVQTARVTEIGKQQQLIQKLDGALCLFADHAVFACREIAKLQQKNLQLHIERRLEQIQTKLKTLKDKIAQQMAAIRQTLNKTKASVTTFAEVMEKKLSKTTERLAKEEKILSVLKRAEANYRQIEHSVQELGIQEPMILQQQNLLLLEEKIVKPMQQLSSQTEELLKKLQ